MNVNARKGQVSIEYLLLISAFFAAFALLLPQVSIAVDQFFVTNDALLAKQIAQTIEEEVSLFEFLGNGSKKSFSFSPAKQITFITQNNILTVSTEQKEFTISFPNKLLGQIRIFEKKFSIEIQKQNNLIAINFV
jgi:hypothetical protein